MEEKQKQKPKQREFIKDYNTIVPFLKKVFYYGTLSSSDYEEMNMMKKSKYSYYKRILEYVFGNLLYESKNTNGKKALSLRIDHFCDPYRSFLRFFSLKSYTSNARLMMICSLLQILSDGKSYRVKDIVESINGNSEKGFEEMPIRRLLKDMTEKGITEITKDGYRIPSAALYDLPDNVRSELATLTDLCTNIYPLSICGDHVRSKLKRDHESLFLFKHRHFGQIFNDEIIWKLCGSICNKKVLVIGYKDKQLRSVLPYRIITDEFSGRQYVFVVYTGTNDEYDRLLRVDRIRSIEEDTADCSIPDDTELENRYHNALRYSFTGTTVPYGKEPDTGTLEFTVNAEYEVRRRFPDADIETVDEDSKKCFIKVNSMTELKPWLRVNIGRIRLAESSDDTVEELEKELQEWRDMYESV